MKSVVVGAHLHREDIEPVAEAIEVAGVFLSAVPVADDQPLGDRDLLVKIAGIRGRLLEKAAFIAIRYGFAVRNASQAAAKCAALAPKWRELLIAHRDDVEMTLKTAATSPTTRPDRRDFPSGAAYLRALHEAAQAVVIDPAFRAGVERALVPLSREHRWIHRDNASLELALLVRRSDLDAVCAAGEQLRRDFPTAPFLLSGPWPLEVFADDDHE